MQHVQQDLLSLTEIKVVCNIYYNPFKQAFVSLIFDRDSEFILLMEPVRKKKTFFQVS